jgi:hypothetical protein
VLLTIDNFSGHRKAVEEVPPPLNILIEFSPANTTSVFQPLDQAIIYTLKRLYRKRWATYMVDTINNGGNPLDSMTILDTIRWVNSAWKRVRPQVIQNCQRKSTLISLDPIEDLPIPEVDLSEETENLRRVMEANNMQQVISIENILNPADEDSNVRNDETQEEIETIIARNAEEMLNPDGVGLEEDNGVPVRAPVNTRKALEFLEELMYKLPTINENEPDICEPLLGMQAALSKNLESSRKQNIIDQFFLDK